MNDTINRKLTYTSVAFDNNKANYKLKQFHNLNKTIAFKLLNKNILGQTPKDASAQQ